MGNPLKSEGAAFRWLVAVLVAAVVVVLAAVLVSSALAAAIALVLVVVVSVLIIRGMAGMLRTPEQGEEPADVMSAARASGTPGKAGESGGRESGGGSPPGSG